MSKVDCPANRDHQEQQVEPAGSQQTPQRLCISLAGNPACTQQVLCQVFT